MHRKSIRVIRSVRAMQRWSHEQTRSGRSIAFVPTMGFLHDGHLSLIRRARQEADLTVVSIFVNPTQFGPHEDFQRYPRDERGDLSKVTSEGADLVFLPSRSALYPDGYETFVDLGSITGHLEGAVRPGHFRGVATIVTKLFHLVQPDVAIFGQKDFQQAAVIRTMISDLNLPVRLVVAPTIREKDGLAMSSRNVYLSPAHRMQAVALVQSLRHARQRNRATTNLPAATVRAEMKRIIARLAPDGQIDYIAFTDERTLVEQERLTRQSVASLAVRFGSVRLIDNMRLR